MILMTLNQFFEEGYFHFAINIFSFILVFFMFITTLIKTKKTSVIQIMIATLIFCVVVFRPFCSFVLDIEPSINIGGKEIDFDLYSTILSFSLLFISHLVYLLNTKSTFAHKLLYRLAPENLGKKVYAYYDSKGKVVSYTESFFEELSIPMKKDYKWYEEVSSFNINGKELNYKGYKNFIKDSSDITFKITLVVDNEEVTFVMEKWTIESDDKVVGFILTQKEEKVINDIDGFFYLMEKSSSPFAYYNDLKTNVCFKINKELASLLGIRGNMLSYEELEKYVVFEDLETFKKKTNNQTTQSYKYKVQTNNGIKLFEEIKMVVEEKIYIMINVSDIEKEVINDKKYLQNKVNEIISRKEEFGALLLSLNSVNNMFDESGVDITKEITKKYIDILLKDYSLDITRISDMEYCLLFTNINKFNNLVADIVSEKSYLLDYNITYNEASYTISNSIGIVYGASITTSNALFNALGESISIVNNKEYDKRYHIRKNSPKVIVTKEYRFEDYKIDLDNGFLNED